MAYYTLSELGYAWAADEASAPPKYKAVLEAIASLVTDNDVPRVASQIAHITKLTEAEAEKGLKYLEKLDYVVETRLPRPELAARTRLPTIEQLVAAEERRLLAQKRYFEGPKGQAALHKYWKEGGGRLVRKAYWDSDKGKLTQKIYRLKRRLKELYAALETHPHKTDELNILITKAQAELAATEALRKEGN